MKTYGFDVCRLDFQTPNVEPKVLELARANPLPDFTASGVSAVDFNLLAEQGIDNVLLDLDLTLRRAWSKTIDSDIVDHIADNRRAGNIGFVAIATDSNDDLESFARQIGADAVYQPSKNQAGDKINKAAAQFWKEVLGASEIDAQTTVNIGDRYKKDVKVPGSSGISTVLVNPLGKDYWFDRLGPVRNVRKKDMLELGHAQHAWTNLLNQAGVDTAEL